VRQVVLISSSWMRRVRTAGNGARHCQPARSRERECLVGHLNAGLNSLLPKPVWLPCLRNYQFCAHPRFRFKVDNRTGKCQPVNVSRQRDKALENVLLGKPARSRRRSVLVSSRPARLSTDAVTGLQERNPKKMNALPIFGARDRISSDGQFASSAGVRSGISHILGRTALQWARGEARTPRSGMCEAIKRSFKPVFGGIAMYLDADKLVDRKLVYEPHQTGSRSSCGQGSRKVLRRPAVPSIARKSATFDILECELSCRPGGPCQPSDRRKLDCRLPPGEARPAEIGAGRHRPQRSGSPLSWRWSHIRSASGRSSAPSRATGRAGPSMTRFEGGTAPVGFRRKAGFGRRIFGYNQKRHGCGCAKAGAALHAAPFCERYRLAGGSRFMAKTRPTAPVFTHGTCAPGFGPVRLLACR